MTSFAVLSGDVSGTANTTTSLQASGDLDALVVDFDGNPLVPQPGGTWSISTAPSSGSATVDANGTWTYTVDPNDPVFDGLTKGDIVNVTFEVEFDPTGLFNLPGTADVSIDITYICFTTGTLIDTPSGPARVEDLEPGDLVSTIDSGPQPVVWAGSQAPSEAAEASDPALWPVRIRAGALGAATPPRDLCLSPQHRVLLRSGAADLMFGTAEVLVSARALTRLEGVDPEPPAEGVLYHHILLDRHEIVAANGMPAETLFLGDEALYAIEPGQLAELAALIPDHPEAAGPGFGPPARRILKEYEAALLLDSLTDAAAPAA